MPGSCIQAVSTPISETATRCRLNSPGTGDSLPVLIQAVSTPLSETATHWKLHLTGTADSLPVICHGACCWHSCEGAGHPSVQEVLAVACLEVCTRGQRSCQALAGGKHHAGEAAAAAGRGAALGRQAGRAAVAQDRDSTRGHPESPSVQVCAMPVQL